MTDSFFTTRNLADPQFENTSHLVVMQFLDASARRMATLEGPLEASKRLQRLADICSGAYVLPIEHWQKLETSKAQPEPPRSRARRVFDAINDSAGWTFWIGFFTGIFIGGS